MDSADAAGVLRRQWLVVVTGLVLTVTAMLLAFGRTPPTYESQAQVLLLPPSVATDAAGRVEVFSNPYLQLDYALSSATDVLVRILATAPMQESILAAGGGSTLSIERASPDSGGSVPPVVLVTASDADPGIARATAQAAVDALQSQLESMQKVTGSSRALDISSEVIEPPTAPVPLMGSRLRALAAIAAAGLLASFLAAFAVEWIRGRRARRRADLPEQRIPVDVGP